MKKRLCFMLMLCMCGGFCSAAQIGFNCVTNNSMESGLVGNAQLYMDVLAVSSNKVSFTFHNAGPEKCVISEIYFDDDTYLRSIYQINDSLRKVDFSPGARPANLPGGCELDQVFYANPNLSISARKPAPKKGVGPNEWVTVVFEMQDDINFDGLLGSLQNGSTRVGMHVIGFDNGCSESFINEYTSTAIPEPASMLLMGMGGLIFLAGKRRNAIG